MNQNKHKGLWGLVPMLLVTIILLILYASYKNNLTERINLVNNNIKEGTTIVLSHDIKPDLLSKIIFDNGYCDSFTDASYIAQTLAERQQKERLKSLYSLQKRDIGQVFARIADSLHVLDKVLSDSRRIIGIVDNIDPDNIYTPCDNSDSITVVVERELRKEWYQIRTPKERCEGVPVRLQLHHHNDSLNNPLLIGYGVTDINGVVVFRGLCADSSYSVLPIKEGFEYGGSKGVVGGEWIIQRNIIKRSFHNIKNWVNNTKDNEFNFIEKEHKIPLFNNTTLRLIKNEGSIIVRTPDEFMKELDKSRVLLIVSWWFLALVFLFFPNRSKILPIRKLSFSSGIIIACCMFLSGLSILMMFSMVDPFNDELRGWDMTKGVIVGVLFAVILQSFDFNRIYHREKFPFYAYFEKKHCRGLGWLVVALLLTSLLFTPLGSSVGGMKVNLNIGFKFQPSEIAKYLIIIFTAIFFTENIDNIIHYSNEFDANYKKKFKTMMVVAIGLMVLILIYLFLGDMGPGLVLGVTFVLLYSFSKSKQDLRDQGIDKWKRWLKCDFMMLIYGVLSYILILLLLHNNFRYWYIYGTILWLIIWIAAGLFPIRRTPSGRFSPVYAKQVHETAIIMNLVIFVFVLGSNAGKGNDTGVLGRLEERTSMCTNTWGGMDYVYNEVRKHGVSPKIVMSEPVSNTQVAHGLWALASGGLKGQGLGNGKPSVIPAFHTDMILSSIGEQLGWRGLLLVIFTYFVLLVLVAWRGIKTGENLSVFLCMGVAIVTAVQLLIIALGSSGVIPLTGVSVPLLSYGKVSMILNIVAFGLVLSLVTQESNTITSVAEINHERVKANNIETFKKPYLIPTVCFAIGCIFTLFVWAKYQILKQNRTLIQPAYVINKEGNPVLEYNPRITLVSNEMYAGRIFDRNGLLLATSNKNDITGALLDTLVVHGINKDNLDVQKRRHLKRYYPFEEHLFFMVGDINTRLLFSSPEEAPVGYMAEERHLSYLRGFDNILYDKNHNRIQVKLTTNRKRDDKYLQKETEITGFITLYDYSALLPYLKDGSGRKLLKHNKSVEKGEYDLYLTVDADLQKDIQVNLADYITTHFSNNHLMRASVVVLNAKNGDLLASANYPKIDYNRIIQEEKNAKDQGKKYAIYNDNNRPADWIAYTDRDLGTTKQTAPGSTAKVMSAMAGLMKMGQIASKQKYYISPENRVEIGQYPEPSGYKVTMKEAIVKSSNCYFINMVNSNDLYPELETIYKTIGVSVSDIIPYYYRPVQDETKYQRFHDTIAKIEKIALRKYSSFSSDIKKNEIKMNMGEWKWAWGQGFNGHELKASPLNMARLASAIVNNGIMPNTQYVIIKQKKNKQEKALRQDESVQLLKKDEADILKNYMFAEAANQHNRQNNKVNLPSYVGGKTGTPERERQVGTIRKFNRKTGVYELHPNLIKMNDGWYMFFVEGNKEHDPLAVVVRLERGVGSGEAVKLSGNMLLDLLKEHGYTK